MHLEALPHSNSLQAEKAKEKEEHSELKEKLDEEYREIAELLKGSAASATAEKQAPKKSEVCVLLYVVVPPCSPCCASQKDNYDVIVRELAFDLKARPTDRYVGSRHTLTFADRHLCPGQRRRRNLCARSATDSSCSRSRD